jgi:hypothetical protein
MGLTLAEVAAERDALLRILRLFRSSIPNGHNFQCARVNKTKFKPIAEENCICKQRDKEVRRALAVFG